MKTTAAIALAFALGALTDAALGWRLRLNTSPEHEAPILTTEADADAPTGTGGSGRTGEAGGASNTADAGHRADPTEAIAALGSAALEIPVEGVTSDQLHDSFTEARGSTRAHEAIDIMAPRRTPVLAARDGTIAKLFTSKQGGLTIYEFDPSQTFCYYYAHLDGYADGVHEGQAVRRGQVIGYVGSTGNASPEAPHLHFAIFKLTPEHQWWKGDAINPYPVLKQAQN